LFGGLRCGADAIGFVQDLILSLLVESGEGSLLAACVVGRGFGWVVFLGVCTKDVFFEVADGFIVYVLRSHRLDEIVAIDFLYAIMAQFCDINSGPKGLKNRKNLRFGAGRADVT
jgi:hypothetical protein